MKHDAGQTAVAAGLVVAVLALGADANLVRRAEHQALVERVAALEQRCTALERLVGAKGGGKPAKPGTAEFDWYEDGQLEGTFCFFADHSFRSATGHRRKSYSWELNSEGISLQFYSAEYLVTPVDGGPLRAEYLGPKKERIGAVAWLVPCGRLHSQNLAMMIEAERRELVGAVAEGAAADSKDPGDVTRTRGSPRPRQIDKEQTEPFKVNRLTLYNGDKGYLRADVRLRYSRTAQHMLENARFQITVYTDSGEQSTEGFTISSFAPGTERVAAGIKLGKVPKEQVSRYCVDYQ